MGWAQCLKDIWRVLPWIIVGWDIVSSYFPQIFAGFPSITISAPSAPSQPSAPTTTVDISQIIQLITGILPLFLILSLLRAVTKKL